MLFLVIPQSCSDLQFTCGHQCIPKAWLCDGTQDCENGKDEMGCKKASTTKAVCVESEWMCDSGECIVNRWKCDGESDCRDGSDEKGCRKFLFHSSVFTFHRYALLEFCLFLQK